MLEDLQKKFLEAFYANEIPINFIKDVKSSSQLSADARFKIYRNSITACLVKAIQDIYPVCEKLVGTDFFLHMVKQFIAVTPSISPNLNDYGENFFAFVADYPPAKSLPYLSDVCRFEWAMHRAYFNEEREESLDYTRLSTLNEQQQAQIIFGLPLCSTLFESSFPIHQIWVMNQEEYSGEEKLQFNQQVQRIFVFRRDGKIVYETISEEEFTLLTVFSQKKNLEKACEELLSRFPHIEIPELISKAVAQGWVNSFSF